MGITSFYFLCFFAGILILYYMIPGKLQWGLLLLGSVAYYLLSGNGILILYPVVSVTACYAGTRLLLHSPAEAVNRRRWILAVTVLINIGILVVLKYVNFGIYTIDGIARMLGSSETLIRSVDFLIPLGVSFYTFSLLGYVVDVYYGIARPQENYLKLLLYGMYFPVILSGPILKYREHGEQFFAPHRFEYHRVARGLQRMVWGFFKKLVIAERLGTLVDTVYGGYTEYPGAYIWVATACYAFQLYTDFSGCMDIVLGMSESLGIILPENFQTPFFAKSIAEYWRRWHITLGVWMKDYVFYPVTLSGWMKHFSKFAKRAFGKQTGRTLPICLANLIVFFVVGIWHGAAWKFIVYGLYNGLIIAFSGLMAPAYRNWKKALHISDKSRAFHLFQMARTFVLVNISWFFDRAEDVPTAVLMMKNTLRRLDFRQVLEPGIEIGEASGTTFTVVALGVILGGCLLLFAVSVLQEQGKDLAEIFTRQHWLVKAAVYLCLILALPVLGQPSGESGGFIYAQF